MVENSKTFLFLECINVEQKNTNLQFVFFSSLVGKNVAHICAMRAETGRRPREHTHLFGENFVVVKSLYDFWPDPRRSCGGRGTNMVPRVPLGGGAHDVYYDASSSGHCCCIIRFTLCIHMYIHRYTIHSIMHSEYIIYKNDKNDFR